MNMQQIIDDELIRHLVAREITCPRTGKVLDMRTCLVIRDGDGDPIAVLDPSVADDVEVSARIAEKGWTLDTRSAA